MEPTIIYEDSNLVAVNKPASLIVHHPKHQPNSEEPSLVDWLLVHYPEIKTVGDDPQERPGLVHRLDKATSGLLVIARNQFAFNELKSLFQSRSLKKTYLAIVNGSPSQVSGLIDKPIGLKPNSVKRTVHGGKMIKPALTEYELIESFTKDETTFSLIKVCPKTGRTHQIRVHLTAIGCPIVGDTLYQKRPLPVRLMLHAWRLELPPILSSPSLCFEAPPPSDFFSFLPDLKHLKINP